MEQTDSPAGQPTKHLGWIVQCEVLADDAIKLRFPGPSRRGRAGVGAVGAVALHQALVGRIWSTEWARARLRPPVLPAASSEKVTVARAIAVSDRIIVRQHISTTRECASLFPPISTGLMALNTSRSVWSTSRQALRPFRPTVARPACRANHQIARHPTALREKDDPLNEPISEADIEEARPRWSYTPEGLKGIHGFSLNVPKVPHRSVWHVNEDPAKLDDFYERFLGRNGSKLLPEELKWLAVTHKSFDFGRRGFNTRLAFYGRQIIVLEAMNEIMTSPRVPDDHLGDPWKRKHYESPALQNVDKLSMTRPQDIISLSGLASVGLNNRLNDVMRWKPRNPDNLKGSGIETVLATSIFAIIGAVSLQHGAEAASKLARERVIRRIKQ